ncbi:hypothetical protein FC52_GL000721 [Lactobacillus pasteurii DSM 23907 = CRBIP 24.76]|nr:hypothetical protein FC52_GL000721 [Lactobacillus pasteurii DSM 23907 = CRBIP 24.76]
MEDDLEVIYHQIDASGTMQVKYQYHEPQGLFLPDKLVTISAGELSAGQSETIGNVTIRNPFASNKTFEIIYVPISDVKQEITRKVTITEPGQKTRTITQIAEISRSAKFDPKTDEVTYGNWSTNTADWTAVDVPSHAGYTTHISNGADSIPAVTVKDGQQSETIDVTYTANSQTGKIVYVDVDNQNSEVGHTDLTGDTDQDVTITPKAPAGYDIVAGQNIPATEKATADGIPTVTVQVNHHKRTVTPGDEPKPGDKIPGNPNKQPGDGTPKTDVSYETLHRNMTRTINVTDPHTGLKTTKVTLHYERTATIDDVTGEVTYGNWTVVDGSQAGFEAFNIPTVAGYSSEIKSGSADDLQALTPSQAQITDWTDQTVDIDYTANDQTMHITYVDKAGHPVDGGSFTVSGKTDQTVTTNAKVPAGWVLSQGQTYAPETIKFTGTPTADITITVEHGTKRIQHDNPVIPGDKTPSGKEIKGAHDEDLNQTITRTINITEPGQATKTTTQVAHIYRDATVDDVTGEVTYSGWSTDSADWTAVNVPSHDGYTAHQSDGQTGIPAVTVKDGQKGVNIDVTYTANDGTVLIKYVDRDGNEIGQQVITGYVGETIKVTPQFPENWVPVDPDTVPAEVQIKEENGQIIIVVVRHAEKDPVQTKKVTRTITVTTPDGQTKTIKQVVTISRHGDLDLVTGQIAWQPWTTAQWDVFKPAAIAGYTPSLAEVPAVTVDGETTDQTVDITYAAVATPAQPEHLALTASDTTDAQQATNQKADSNAQPAVTVVTSQQTATAQQAESTTNSRLPQTGNSHDASALAGLGLASLGLVSLMGLFGLGGKRRKRD